MAQKFLEQLLRIENTVQKNEHDAQNCMICLEPYGALNSSTGAVELSVRLPCKHLVGTICIAKWLRDNNNCPLCRASFFSAQPRPYLEHGIMMDTERSMNDRTADFRVTLAPSAITSTGIMRFGHEIRLLDKVKRICLRLGLPNETREMAQSFTSRLSRRFQEQVDLPVLVDPSEANAVISIYIATHLLNQDVNVAEICAGLRVYEDMIPSIWAQIYPDRMGLITPGDLPSLARLHMEGIRAFLPTPESEFDVVIPEGTIEPWLSDLLRDADLQTKVEDLSEYLLDGMHEHAEYLGFSTQADDLHDAYQEAVCDFMACHLLGVAVSYNDIARIVQVSERTLRQVYAYVYGQRSGLIDADVTAFMGNSNMERVLGVLPALNWPST